MIRRTFWNRDWLLLSGLLLLSLVPSLAGSARLAQLAAGGPITGANLRFFALPLPVVLHIIAVVPYSLVGALQFAPGFRRRYRAWHRASGRVLVVLGLLAALSGLWMTQFYPWPAGDGIAVYIERMIVGTLMLISMVLAIEAIRRRDFVAHGAWMTRAYAIGVGAGTQALTHLPYFIFYGLRPSETVRGWLMGSAWVINMIVAEWVIRRRLVSTKG